MQVNFKNEFEARYTEIFKRLYVEWKKHSKDKTKELQEKGIYNSGVGRKMMCELAETLIYDTIDEIQWLFETIQKEYNREIPLKDLEQLTNVLKESINGHIDIMNKDIMDGNDMRIESIGIFINNLKQNSKIKLDRMYDRIVNLRKGKRIEKLIIINTIVGIVSLVVSIIGVCG